MVNVREADMNAALMASGGMVIAVGTRIMSWAEKAQYPWDVSAIGIAVMLLGTGMAVWGWRGSAAARRKIRNAGL